MPPFLRSSARLTTVASIISTTATTTISSTVALQTAAITTATTTAMSAKNNASPDDDENKRSARATKRVKVEETLLPAAVTPSPKKKPKPKPKKTAAAAAAATTAAGPPKTPTRIKSASEVTAKNKTPAKATAAKKAATTNAATTPTTKKKKSPATRKSRPEPGSKSPPPGWDDIYSLVQELRQDKTAPVDEAGAEVLPETSASPQVFRFQVLMALMLSSQTKDAVVGHAMGQLQQHGLTVENISHHTTHEQLNALIAKVGFHNNKTKYIKQAVEILLEKYGGDIPKTAQEMIDDLPGVGPKMAYLVETIAWGTTSGIGVDTHMHRIFNQLQWVPNTKTPEQTRIELEAWLPTDKWSTVNYVWVGFGQESQQQKPKLLRKALDCSRPLDALTLLKRVGLDPVKEGDKAGFGDEVRKVLKGT